MRGRTCNAVKRMKAELCESDKRCGTWGPAWTRRLGRRILFDCSGAIGTCYSTEMSIVPASGAAIVVT
jgi:hypothetical protein